MQEIVGNDRERAIALLDEKAGTLAVRLAEGKLTTLQYDVAILRLRVQRDRIQRDLDYFNAARRNG